MEKKNRSPFSTPPSLLLLLLLPPFSLMERDLYMAVESGREDTVRLILATTPAIDVNWRTSVGSTALHCACGSDSGPAIISTLLAHPRINVNSKDNFGRTPFMVSCANGQLPPVRRLLADHRVQVNEADAHRFTPLWFAARNGDLDLIKHWIASGKWMEFGDTGNPTTDAIGVARRERHDGVLSLLERFKASPGSTKREIRRELERFSSGHPALSPLLFPGSAQAQRVCPYSSSSSSSSSASASAFSTASPHGDQRNPWDMFSPSSQFAPFYWPPSMPPVHHPPGARLLQPRPHLHVPLLSETQRRPRASPWIEEVPDPDSARVDGDLLRDLTEMGVDEATAIEMLVKHNNSMADVIEDLFGDSSPGHSSQEEVNEDGRGPQVDLSAEAHAGEGADSDADSDPDNLFFEHPLFNHNYNYGSDEEEEEEDEDDEDEDEENEFDAGEEEDQESEGKAAPEPTLKGLDKECVVCSDQVIEIFCMVPCGHTSCCGRCLRKVKDCPMCRVRITHRVKIFL